jgi:hypothetical protein
MKVLTTAVALAFLASEAQAWNHVWYWCGRDRNTCFNKGKPYDGVYPTAKCGQKEGWDNYDKAHGKWYMTTAVIWRGRAVAMITRLRRFHAGLV